MKKSRELLYAASFHVEGKSAGAVLRRMAKIAEDAALASAYVVFTEPEKDNELPFTGVLTIEPY